MRDSTGEFSWRQLWYTAKLSNYHFPPPVLYGPRATNPFLVFRWLREESKEYYFMTHENYIKFKFPFPPVGLYWNGAG